MLGLSRDADQEWRSTRCHSPAFSCPSSIPHSLGISCAPRTDHGAAAGVIRFYTYIISAVLAALGRLDESEYRLEASAATELH